MLHGSSAHGYQYPGLLEKSPAISVCDRTLVTDENCHVCCTLADEGIQMEFVCGDAPGIRRDVLAQSWG